MQAFFPFTRESGRGPNDFKQIGVGWVEISFRHSYTSCAAPRPGRDFLEDGTDTWDGGMLCWGIAIRMRGSGPNGVWRGCTRPLLLETLVPPE